MEIPLSIISLGVQFGAKLAFPVTFFTSGRAGATLFLGQPQNAYTQHIPGCQVLFIRIFPFMIDDVMVAMSWKKREKCPWQSVCGRAGGAQRPFICIVDGYGKLGTESRIYGPSYGWGVTLPVLIDLLKTRPVCYLLFSVQHCKEGFILAHSLRVPSSWWVGHGGRSLGQLVTPSP